MEWTSLLSMDKLAAEEEEPSVFLLYPINGFEKDYNKIVSSAAFRRLQDKTQVFPLDKSDFIRTRLTHSIEVSTIARQLGIMISKNETEYRPEDIKEETGEKSPLSCSVPDCSTIWATLLSAISGRRSLGSGFGRRCKPSPIKGKT